jgi:hypothetical protein
MAMVKIPEAVMQVVMSKAADVVANVVNQLAEEKTTTKRSSSKRSVIEVPAGSRVRIRITPRQ